MDSLQFCKYISDRSGVYIDKIMYCNSEYWLNDNGVLYKISTKETSTHFRVSFIICRMILDFNNGKYNSMTDAEKNDHRDFCFVFDMKLKNVILKDFINEIFERIIERNNEMSAQCYVSRGYFSERECDVEELGLWLKPYDYFIKYTEPHIIYPRTPDVCCIDNIFMNTNPMKLADVAEPKNFHILCRNVFGIKTDDDYYELLALFSSSLRRTRGAQKFVTVKGNCNNGKSSFVDVVKNVFKGLFVEITEEAFNPRAAHYDNLPEKRAMAKASCIMIDESDERQKDNTLIKRITSGTTIPYRELAANGGSLEILATVFYFSNNNVVLSEIDGGTLRRLVEYESPNERYPIYWDSEKETFLDVFLKERDGIIRDFIKSFLYKPKSADVEKNIVQSEIDDMKKMFRFEKGAYIQIRDFNDAIFRTFGKPTQKQKRLLKNELGRICAAHGELLLEKVKYCQGVGSSAMVYENITWAEATEL